MKFLIWLKQHCRFVWGFVEWINSLLFSGRYYKRLDEIPASIAQAAKGTVYDVRLLDENDLDSLCVFLDTQPKEAFDFFKPHDFDRKSVLRKLKEKAFIMVGVFEGNCLVGYGFLRCFVSGKAFRGKIVDVSHQGRGIAKLIGGVLTSMADCLDIRLFATISKDNVKSIASSKAVNEIRVVKELPNNYLYLEYLHKK